MPLRDPPSTAEELLERYGEGERDFAEAELRNARLSGARLAGVNLSDAVLVGADLSHADLTGADLSGAIIQRARFMGADLTRANLNRTYHQGADFSGAIISQARLGRFADGIVAQASPIYRGRDEGVFASYDRVDEQLVASIVSLIRALGSRVFMDVDSIVPGDQWRPVLTRALGEAAIIVVFWCAHSAGSGEVKGEFESAHAQRKRIIPVLLDDTPLPAILAQYQYLDFRGSVASHNPPPVSSDSKHYIDDLYASEIFTPLAEPIRRREDPANIDWAQYRLVEAIIAVVKSPGNNLI